LEVALGCLQFLLCIEHFMSDALSNRSETESSELLTLRQERDRACEEAQRWRRCYETEAQQRRAEVEKADQTIRELRAEVLQLCQLGPTVRPSVPTPAPSVHSLDSDPTVERLKVEVAQLRQERDKLSSSLIQEQQQHAKTRENLMSALSEALHRKKT
jgi:hypothetical protein